MIKDNKGNPVSVDEMNEDMEEYTKIYDQLYDKDDNYIGPKKYLKHEEDDDYIPGAPDKSEFIENIKDFDPTPSNLRQHFLKRAAPLVDEYIEGAFDRKRVDGGNAIAKHEVWTMLKEIIMSAKNPAPIVDLKGQTIDEQVKAILVLVSEGNITLEEGQEYLSLVQQGFEMTELPKLMVKMEQLEALGVI